MEKVFRKQQLLSYSTISKNFKGHNGPKPWSQKPVAASWRQPYQSSPDVATIFEIHLNIIFRILNKYSLSILLHQTMGRTIVSLKSFPIRHEAS
jgi:hypothetical protein